NNRSLLVSNDGKSFSKVMDIPGNLVPQTTRSFPEITAKYWRFTIETLSPSPPGMAAFFGAPTSSEPNGIDVAEFNLYETNRVDLFEQKAGFAAWREEPLPTSSEVITGVALENVIDLTDKFDSNGN